MTVLESVLIIIGFVCVCISFFVSRKKVDDKESVDTEKESKDIWTENDEKYVSQRIESIFNEELKDRKDELVFQTENELNELCNEKMQAFDEYSEETKTHIDHTHQEVLFMYDMLVKKEQELTDHLINSSKIELEQKNDRNDSEVLTKEAAASTKVEVVDNDILSFAKMSSVTKEKNDDKIEIQGDFDKEKNTNTKVEPPAKPNVFVTDSVELDIENNDDKVRVPGNVNLQIQKMYREGKSVVEISKELGRGQGEVNLVIALYGGRKR